MYVLAYMYLIYSDHCNNQHHTQWDKSQQYDYTAVHSSNVHNFLNNPRRTCCFDKLFHEAEKKPVWYCFRYDKRIYPDVNNNEKKRKNKNLFFNFALCWSGLLNTWTSSKFKQQFLGKSILCHSFFLNIL